MTLTNAEVAAEIAALTTGRRYRLPTIQTVLSDMQEFAAQSDFIVAASVTAMRAIAGLRVGQSIAVGDSTFIVVDDSSALGSDGGTVFIPDSELSTLISEVIPPGTFTAATDADVAMGYSLSHAGIDLESVECVLTNGGETITGWQMHGHVMAPTTTYRQFSPQLPLIDTANGKFRDPYGALTGYTTKTGGLLIRYKYATSGLRLKRVTGDRFDLRWWPVTSVDDESGPQVDNTDYICWANNAAALAGAQEIYHHDFYHYGNAIEQPDGVAWVGRGPDLSGLVVMDEEGYSELLLSKSTAPNAANHPGAAPYSIWFKYQHFFKSYTPTVSAASGAKRLTLEDISLDGNADNNLAYWTDQSLYANGYADSNQYFYNSPLYTGYNLSNAQARVVPEGQKLIIRGHVKITGYGGGSIIGDGNNRTIQTGLLEVGDSLHNHWLYHVDGEFDNLHCSGYCAGDGIRVSDMSIRNLRMIPTRFPDARFDNDTSVTYPATATLLPLTYIFGTFPQVNWAQANEPLALPVHQFICDNFTMDLSAFDAPGSGLGLQFVIPISLASDNFQIRSGRLRGWRHPTQLSIYATYGNGFQYGPYRNVYSNFSIETPSRAGVQFFASNTNDGSFHNATFINPIERLAATPVPEDAHPDGVGNILGNLRFSEAVDGYDGWGIDFSGATAAGLSGDYIDITTPDAGTPSFRVWFDYNSSSSAPSAGGKTLIEVDIGVGASADTIAQAAAAALLANASAFSYITAYSHPVRTPSKLAVGSHTLYRSYPAASGILTIDVTNATGVTKAQRAQQRMYRKSIINFEKSDWGAPTPAGLLDMPASSFGADRDVTLNFSECEVGAFTFPYLKYGTTGNLNDAGPTAIKDRFHANFTDCVLHSRKDAGMLHQPANMDLFWYVSKLRNCRFTTDDATLGELKSEDYGTYSWAANGSDTTIDIPTALGWGPKVFRVEPADAATQAIWSAKDAFATYRRKGGTALGGTGAYYQGPDGVNEDRRAPVLRVTFSSAPAAATYKFNWYGAISP
jgi:hypothetical protein